MTTTGARAAGVTVRDGGNGGGGGAGALAKAALEDGNAALPAFKEALPACAEWLHAGGKCAVLDDGEWWNARILEVGAGAQHVRVRLDGSTQV